jgi:hypothetical protein
MSFIMSRLITIFKGVVAIGVIGIGIAIGRRGATSSLYLRVLR